LVTVPEREASSLTLPIAAEEWTARLTESVDDHPVHFTAAPHKSRCVAGCAYQRRNGEVIRRYGWRLANRTIARLERIRSILAAYGTFPVIAALKPW